MLLLGLTGSIGMGKSTVAGRLRELGVLVCDADAIVHNLYEGDAVGLVEAEFQGVTVDGKIDRRLLSRSLGTDSSGFKKLESIIHPLVQAREREFLTRQFDVGASLAAIEVPLLFETHGDARVDVTMVVSAPYSIQKERVLQRPGMSEAKFNEILSRQLPDREKRRRADFVVDTGQEMARSFAEVDAIIKALRIRKGTAFARYWR